MSVTSPSKAPQRTADIISHLVAIRNILTAMTDKKARMHTKKFPYRLERLDGEMKMMSKKDWIINLENAAAEVAVLLGQETVQHVLQKYGARSIDDLSPCYYSEAFDELDFMANDARD